MTHEERARDILGVEHYKACWEDLSGRPTEHLECVCPIGKVTSALASAEKKGREDERKRIEEFSAYTLTAEGFKGAWNQAVKACAKVAEEYCIGGLEDVCKSIANKIRGLLK